MKVILIKDVAKLGKKYEVKEVADGYALNFLVPHGQVEVATPKAMKKVELLHLQEVQDKKVQEDLLLKNLKSLEGVTITLKEKANEKGHLFAGIHKAELIPEIKKQTELDIAPEYIELEKPIKEVGEHLIEVKVQDKIAKFKVVVDALK